MTGDMTETITPKSTQLNADDLIGRDSVTIKIVSVRVVGGDQPVAISFAPGTGLPDRPYLPCKSMRRVLVEAWGSDSAKYVGRSLRLVRDPTVRFGKDEVGGIRIAAMSDLAGPMRVALTVTKGKRAPYEVQPMGPVAEKKAPTAAEKKANAKTKADAIAAEIASSDDVMGVLGKHKDTIERLRSAYADLAKSIDDAAAARQTALTTETTDKLTQPALIADDSDRR